MSLPKIKQPLFDLKIPSLNKTIKARPFLVSEEKILLMGQQSGDTKDIIFAIQQVVANCIQDETIAVQDLTIFDLEYMFLKLRSRSVNNIVEVSYRDPQDEKKYDFQINLDEIEVVENPSHSNTVKVSDEMTIKLRYPKVEMMDKMAKINSEVDIFFEVLKYSIESIIVGDNVFKMSDYPEAEQEQFISDLDVKSFKKISEFFNTMPRLRHEIKYTNELNVERSIVLETLNDFFSLC